MMILRGRAFAFASAVVRQHKRIAPFGPEFAHIGLQLVRSASSVGAMLEEADAAASRREMAFKQGIALREAKESKYWLSILTATEVPVPELPPLLQESDEIVAMYAQRMQIEECFRDTKSVVRGMGFEIGRSTTELRLQALLMVAGLAAFLLWHIGQLGEAEGLHRRFKATTRVERELSLITLGILLCVQSDIPLSPPALRTLQQRLGMRA